MGDAARTVEMSNTRDILPMSQSPCGIDVMRIAQGSWRGTDTRNLQDERPTDVMD